MPTSTETQVTALAHCMQQSSPGELCKGWEQAEVAAVLDHVEYSYADNWGTNGSSDPFDMAISRLVERSVDHLRWADPADAPCPHCGYPRELSMQVRPKYERAHQTSPDALLKLQRDQGSALASTASAVERLADQSDQIAALRAEVAELKASKPPTRKVTPKPEVDDG